MVNSNSWEARALAARALGSLTPGAPSAIPALTRAVNDSNDESGRVRGKGAGSYGVAAMPSLPALESRLRKRRDYLTVSMVHAICQIDSQPPTA